MPVTYTSVCGGWEGRGGGDLPTLSEGRETDQSNHYSSSAWLIVDVQ